MQIKVLGAAIASILVLSFGLTGCENSSSINEEQAQPEELDRIAFAYTVEENPARAKNGVRRENLYRYR